MTDNRRVLITGANGYLARELIKRLVANPKVVYIEAVDTAFKNTEARENFRELFSCYRSKINISYCDVRDSHILGLLRIGVINAVYHLAWVFNPTHDADFEWDVNYNGTRNIIQCAFDAGVESFIYTGSTTAYVDAKNTETPLPEEVTPTGTPNYRYSRHKAVVDTMCRYAKHGFRNFVLIRGAIVIGPNTNNVVRQMASLPIMPRVAGYDPPMQFCSEYDMAEILYRALDYKGRIIINVAGEDVVRYSEVARIVGRKAVPIPKWILYPTTELAWKLRCMFAPSGILDLIRYPWIGDISTLKNEFCYIPKFSSKEAVQQYADSRKK